MCMEAAESYWEAGNHSLWNDISFSPCSAGWQTELSVQNVFSWVMPELLISLESPVPAGQVDFWGAGLTHRVSRNQNLSSPPGIALPAPLLAEPGSCLMSSAFSHWFQPPLSKQIPKKTTSTPNLPQVLCWAWNVLLPVAPSNIPEGSREAALIYSRQEPGPEHKFRYFVTL